MRIQRLSQLADLLEAPLVGGDATFTGISIDTRTIQRGNCFLALIGQHHDGHAFLQLAHDHGAVGAVVSKSAGKQPFSTIEVDNTEAALGKIARVHRLSFDIPVIACTGSNGKTTVKEMVASIFAQSHAVVATEGNKNNNIGVPLTLLRLHPGCEAAVVEMGTNHPGEINVLSQITQPTVAVITNAASSHLQELGTVRDVAAEKGDIINGLQQDGLAILNADDDYFDYWKERCADVRIISFGLNRPADVSATYVLGKDKTHVTLRYGARTVDTQLELLGEHNVINAAAAAAVAFGCGVSEEDVAKGLAAVKPVHGRLNVHHLRDELTLIDDTYNANPDSAEAAIHVLAAYPGERIMVLGDMGELGIQSRKLHARVGRIAKRNQIDHLMTFGPMSEAAVADFGPGGLSFSDIRLLIKELKSMLQPNTCVLVKGSRSMKMERVVDALLRDVPLNVEGQN